MTILQSVYMPIIEVRTAIYGRSVTCSCGCGRGRVGCGGDASSGCLGYGSVGGCDGFGSGGGSADGDGCG